MMTKHLKMSFALVSLLVLSATALPLAASTMTINFSDLSAAGTGFNAAGAAGSYTQDGFTFQASAGAGPSPLIGAWESSNPNAPAGGVAATSLVPYYEGAGVTISPTSGVFDLLSIDLADFGADQGGGTGNFTITFTGDISGGGTVSQTFTVARTATPTLSTYDFAGFDDLTAVTFNQGTYAANLYDAVQFNNLVVSPSAVPEPSALILLLLGSALLAAAFYFFPTMEAACKKP
jgi:hypothetical protein